MTKQAHTVSCSSPFRKAVMALAADQGVNIGDLARSVLLLLPLSVIDSYPDPGEPEPGDREPVLVKSGPARGRVWRRKPRLQLRLPESIPPDRVRRCLAMALDLARHRLDLTLRQQGEWARLEAERAETMAQTEQKFTLACEEREALRKETERLRSIIITMMSEALPGGIKTRADALYVMGFPPGRLPDAKTVKGRFRQLAIIHHPDSGFGDHHKMSQLNAAMAFLQRGGF